MALARFFGNLIRYAVNFGASLALGMVFAVAVGTLGLVVPGAWILPVTFVVAAAFSALAATWASNLDAWGASRARLGWVLLGTEATALVVLALYLGAAWTGLPIPETSFFVEILVSVIPIALNATILSVRLRGPRGRWMLDVLMSLAVAALALLAPVLLLVLGCPYIGCSG